MSKSTRKTVATATAVVKFDIQAWREAVNESALVYTTAGVTMLNLMIEARGKLELDTAREILQGAFGGAYAQTFGVTFDEACKAKTVMNRVSDGMAILKAEKLPESLPGNIQRAADAVRKANPSGKTRKPRQPVAPKVDAGDVNPLALLQAALEALRKQVGDNEDALELITSMVDDAAELASVLLAEAQADKAAKNAAKKAG